MIFLYFGMFKTSLLNFRSGPGIKSFFRGKKQNKVEDNVARSGVETNESPDKFKRKHERKRKLKPLTDKDVRKRNPSIDISPFLDMSFWKRYCKKTETPYGIDVFKELTFHQPSD